jgi:hypothetical protein
MKLTDLLLISLAAAFLIIAIHQIMTVGFSQAYWILMLSVILFFVFSYRKTKHQK